MINRKCWIQRKLLIYWCSPINNKWISLKSPQLLPTGVTLNGNRDQERNKPNQMAPLNSRLLPNCSVLMTKNWSRVWPSPRLRSDLNMSTRVRTRINVKTQLMPFQKLHSHALLPGWSLLLTKLWMSRNWSVLTSSVSWTLLVSRPLNTTALSRSVLTLPTNVCNSFSTTLCLSWNKPNIPKKVSSGKPCPLVLICRQLLIWSVPRWVSLPSLKKSASYQRLLTRPLMKSSTSNIWVNILRSQNQSRRRVLDLKLTSIWSTTPALSHTPSTAG